MKDFDGECMKWWVYCMKLVIGSQNRFVRLLVADNGLKVFCIFALYFATRKLILQWL